MKHRALLFLLVATPSFAQSQSPRSEVFALAGWGILYQDQGNVGQGVDFEGGFAYRPFPSNERIAFQFELSRLTHELKPTALDDFFAEGHATVVTASFVYHYRLKSSFQPFLLVGGGYHYYRGSNGYGPYRDPLTGQILIPSFASPRTDKFGVFNFGAGGRFFLSRHFSVRAEFRLELATDSPFSEALDEWFRGVGGVAYHW